MKVLVVGQSPSWIEKIKKQIAPFLEAHEDVVVSSTQPSYIDSAITEDLKLLIFDTNQMNGMVFSFLDQVRDYGFEGSVVMVGHLPAQSSLSDVTSRENFFFLKKPFVPEQLQGLVKNALVGMKAKQCRNQRFEVREQATLEAYKSGFRTETVIHNISKSGVLIHGNLEGLSEGDLLRLHFRFDQINKQRQLSARVVWVKKEGKNIEQAGLEFVSQRLVYQYLLDHAIA